MNWKEVTINVENSAREAVSNLMIEEGAEGVVFDEHDKKVDITAYYPANNSFEQLLFTLKEKIANLHNYGIDVGDADYKINFTRNEDWATTWHQFFKPVTIGEKFLICPSWEKCSDQTRRVLEIDPGMAFGVGSHETTQLSVCFLEKYIKDDIDSMLDVGTGTGILSIVAANLGVKDILAIDISKAAVEASRENVELNKVKNKVKVVHKDLVDGIEQTFPLVVANLLPDIIQRLLPQLRTCLTENGLLILSGIVIEKVDIIKSQLKDLNMILVDEKREGDWVSLVARKG